MDRMSEFLTRIRNASKAGHEKVDIPSSNFRIGIAEVLKGEGYIRNFKVAKDGRQGIMRVYLKYNSDGTPTISNLRSVSRPGRRVYVATTKIPEVRSGFGMAVVSTHQGVMSGKDARAKNLGGELLCTVW